jgi:hypothetical protein
MKTLIIISYPIIGALFYLLTCYLNLVTKNGFGLKRSVFKDVPSIVLVGHLLVWPVYIIIAYPYVFGKLLIDNISKENEIS